MDIQETSACLAGPDLSATLLVGRLTGVAGGGSSAPRHSAAIFMPSAAAFCLVTGTMRKTSRGL